MKPLRIRINRIINLGLIVSLTGVDTETAEPISIHVDHRPTNSFWEAWRAAGFRQPVEYEADQLILHLDMQPMGDGDEVRLIERDNAGAAAANDDRHPVQEIER
jgi:hypothetical protein